MPPTFAPTNHCADDCPCRLVPRFVENPCACGLYARGTGCPYCEVRSSGTTKEVLDSAREQSKAERLAEFDALMEAAVANVAPVNPKRKKRPVTRRSPQQMERARQRESERLAAVAASAAKGTIVEDNDAELADFVASLGKDE